MSTPEITFALFGAFNVLRLFSYFPQIIRIARDANGATSISYTTWTVWIGANASTAAYAVLNIDDVWLFAMSSFNAACCVVVVALTAWRRRQWRASTTEDLAADLGKLAKGEDMGAA